MKAHSGGGRGDRGHGALGREVGAGSCSWPLLCCVTWSKSHLLSVPFLSGCQVGRWPCPGSQAGRKAGSGLVPMSQPVPGTRGQPWALAGTGRSCATAQRGDRLTGAGGFSRGRAAMGMLTQSISTQAPAASGALSLLPALLLCSHPLTAHPRATKEAAETLRRP